jgi:peptide/nickel transport system ATP-binding protein
MVRKGGLYIFVILVSLISLCLFGCGPGGGQKEPGDNEPAGQAEVIKLGGGDWGYPTPYAHYPRGPGSRKMRLIFETLLTSDRMTVLEVVQEPLEIIRWGQKKEREEEAVSALHKVQLPVSADFLNRHCYALSGGQRQRVAIARSLVTRPKLLIADEVTSMLDPSTQANLLRELKGLQNREGFAMLYITHDLHLARKVADKVYVMYRGEIVEKGVSFEVLERPAHLYTKRLLRESFKDLV